MSTWNALMHAINGNTVFSPYTPECHYYHKHWDAVQIGRYIRENGGMKEFGGKLTVEDVLQWTLETRPFTQPKKDTRQKALRKRRELIKKCGEPGWVEPETKVNARKRKSSVTDDTVSPEKRRKSEKYHRYQNKKESASRTSGLVSEVLTLVKSLSSEVFYNFLQLRTY